MFATCTEADDRPANADQQNSDMLAASAARRGLKRPTIFSHNGVFTVVSAKTGEHRTFKVRSQKKDASFAPGMRIVYLLTGPNNQEDYTGFGFVVDGEIKLWSRFRTEQYTKLANMLTNLEEHREKGHVRVMAETTCRRCNRPLTNPSSILSGIGPECASKS